MERLTKKLVMELTDGGLKLFQILLPDLKMLAGRNVANIDSPISKGKRCLSIFKRSEQLYYFKDHFTGRHGDIFEFIARLNKLDSKYDFKHILEIIQDILDDCYYQIPVDQIEAFVNEADNTSLTLVNQGHSKKYIDKHFVAGMPYLEASPLYPMQLVQSFAVYSEKKRISYEFDYANPNNAFYSLKVKTNEYYILFNPATRKCFMWGKMPEYYIVGIEHLSKIAYCDNLSLRKVLVITNTVEGLLFLQDKGIPSLALLGGESELPDHFNVVISPLFSKKYLLLGMGPNCDKQFSSLIDKYRYEVIKVKETSYLGLFFSKNANAVDLIMNNFEFEEDFICEGFASQIKKIA